MQKMQCIFFMTINKGPDIWPFNTIVTVKM